ncbi:MAG: TetR/AcrR family transcriptional repressor of nem operon [Saprospiraceae bacterium]|jgi:TetR/AcrR family transcriptional repressor of nem operon
MPRNREFDEKAVLEKAKNLFWKQGYHATSIQDLVNNLGINRASLYNTFGGKNELYEAALTAYQEENSLFLRKRLKDFTSVRTGLKSLFREAILESIKDPDRKGCFVVNCTTEYLPDHPHILADLLDNQKTFKEIIRQALQRGIDDGEFSNTLNVEEVAAYFFIFFSGLKITSKIQNDSQEILKTIDVGFSILD